MKSNAGGYRQRSHERLTIQFTEAGRAPPSRLANLSDAQLVERCRQNDHSAFDVLIGRYERQIYGLAFRMALNHEVAEDVAAESRIRIYRAMHTLQEVNTLIAWINRIVTNVYFNIHRQAHRRPSVSLDGLMEMNGDTFVANENEAAASPHGLAEASERRTVLNAAIDALPSHQRKLVLLFHRQDRSYEEISERLQVPMGTVKSRLYRARLALREILDPEISLP